MAEVKEPKESIEEQVSYLRGSIEQMDKRFTHALEQGDKQFEQIEKRLTNIESEMQANFRWLVGIMILMWVSLLGTIVSLYFRIT